MLDIDGLPDFAEKTFSENLSFFEDYDVNLFKEIEKLNSRKCFLQFDESGLCDNILVNNKPFYNPNLEVVCEQQVIELSEKPDRLILKDYSQFNLSPLAQFFITDFHKDFFEKYEDVKALDKPLLNSGYFFLFGMGTGHIVEKILNNFSVRNIIITEPVMEFFFQSLYIIEWSKIFAKAERKGVRIYFNFNTEPYAAVEAIEKRIQGTGIELIDGSYFFIHYPSWELKESHRFLKERMKNYIRSSGFYEDELLMVRNTYMNLENHDLRYLERKSVLNQDYPVFIAGSGPSLEYDLEQLKKIRDQVILVTSGTTLHLILKNGMKPDFHAELENSAAVWELLKELNEKFSFEGITLMASSTVDPRLPELFDEMLCFSRGGISAASVFFNNEGSIYEVGPMSANTAITCMATLGFTNFYLVGVDCGRYDGASHHASGSVYDDIGLSDLMEECMSFGNRVPGNFGGEVSTTDFLNISRRSITALIKRKNLNVYNCSHGAKIDLAKPLSSMSVKLTNKPGQQETIKKRVIDQMTFFEKGEITSNVDLNKLSESTVLFEEAVQHISKDIQDNDETIYELYLNLTQLRKREPDTYESLFSIVGGSFSSMIRVAAFMSNRMIDEKDRKHYLEFFLVHFQRKISSVMSELREFLLPMIEGEKEIKRPKHFSEILEEKQNP